MSPSISAVVARCCAAAVAALALIAGPQAAAQESRVFRCPGNEYINNATEAKQRGCKPMEGGNITIVQGTRPATEVRPMGQGVVTAPRRPAGDDGGNNSAEQRARDADARAILENELRRAQQRQADLQKEYNNGEPEKLGPETRNYQKYLDRVAELKAAIDRNDSDIAGIQREIARLNR